MEKIGPVLINVCIIGVLVLILSGCASSAATTICMEHGQLLDEYQKRGSFELVRCK